MSFRVNEMDILNDFFMCKCSDYVGRARYLQECGAVVVDSLLADLANSFIGSLGNIRDPGHSIRLIDSSSGKYLATLGLSVENIVIHRNKESELPICTVKPLASLSISLCFPFFKEKEIKRLLTENELYLTTGGVFSFDLLQKKLLKVLEGAPEYLGLTALTRNSFRLGGLPEELAQIPTHIASCSVNLHPENGENRCVFLVPSEDEEVVEVCYLAAISVEGMTSEDETRLKNLTSFKDLPEGWGWYRDFYPRTFIISTSFNISKGVDYSVIEDWLGARKKESEDYLRPLFINLKKLEKSVGYLITITGHQENIFSARPQSCIKKLIKAHKDFKPLLEGGHIVYRDLYGPEVHYEFIGDSSFTIEEVQ